MELDDAFANAAYILNGDAYPDRWANAAAEFRSKANCTLGIAYGASERQKFDLFLPTDAPKGLLVFVHGGYWLRFDRSYWSHFAAGAVAQGWAVAMPSYDLCPNVTIAEIGQQIMRAIGAAAETVDGPLRLAGHSAGGQLVARAIERSQEAPWRARLEKVIPISPVADLVPLLRTSMNADFGLSKADALRESPVYQSTPDVPVSIWVGADERPVFVQQAGELAQAWGCAYTVLQGCHHFDILDGLEARDSKMTLDVCL